MLDEQTGEDFVAVKSWVNSANTNRANTTESIMLDCENRKSNASLL